MSRADFYISEREKELKKMKVETADEFLARGGKIQLVGRSAPRVKSNKLDAQALLDAALGTEHEEEVIRFLASQGLEVTDD